MRVPPDQSETLAEQAASASSGSRSLQRARDVGQPRAEQEGVHALARVGDGMEEMQEQPGVLAHRAGNVEQRHDRRRLGLAARDISGRSRRRRPSGSRAACGAGRCGGRADAAQAAASSRRRSASTRRLIASLAAAISAARHLREVLLLQHLAVGHGQARVELDLVLLALDLLARPENSASSTRCAPACGVLGCAGAPASRGDIIAISRSR